MEMIPELDLDQLDADLYKAWQQLKKANYASAENLVAKSWRQVRLLNLALPTSESSGFEKVLGDIADQVDSACELKGDPEQVERFRSILEGSGAQTRWARVIIIPDLEGWEGMYHQTGRLRATTDRDLRALLTKALYAVLNKLERFPDVRQCHRDGLECEYVYPYGFVPEGGCPRHDP